MDRSTTLRNVPEADVAARLRALEGQRVAVRIVAETDDLVAVFHGRLGAESAEKHPARFWPIDQPGPSGAPVLERPGIYLHEDRFESAALHEGEFVLEIRQAGVTSNVRLLPEPVAE